MVSGKIPHTSWNIKWEGYGVCMGMKLIFSMSGQVEPTLFCQVSSLKNRREDREFDLIPNSIDYLS